MSGLVLVEDGVVTSCLCFPVEWVGGDQSRVQQGAGGQDQVLVQPGPQQLR